MSSRYEPTYRGEGSTVVTVRLGDRDLELLDALAESAYGVDGNYWGGENYTKKRGPVIRLALREAAQRRGVEMLLGGIEADAEEKIAEGCNLARDPRDHRRQSRGLGL